MNERKIGNRRMYLWSAIGIDAKEILATSLQQEVDSINFDTTRE